MQPDRKSTILGYLMNSRGNLHEASKLLEGGGDRRQVLDLINSASTALREAGSLTLVDYFHKLMNEDIFNPCDEKKRKAVKEVGILFWMLSTYPNIFKEFKIWLERH
jgi:hypothetical protein